ncbi:putative reverse transcriptase domain-containing protein [Tanacetum coccineum]
MLSLESSDTPPPGVYRRRSYSHEYLFCHRITISHQLSGHNASLCLFYPLRPILAERMISDGPHLDEEALTAYGKETGQNSVPVPETVLTDVNPRVEESSLETLFRGSKTDFSALDKCDEGYGGMLLLVMLRRKHDIREGGLEKMAPGRRPTVRQNPPVNRSTNRNNVDINSGIDTQMLNQLIATRVAEALAAAAVTHAASTQEETNLGSNSSQNKACNYKEFRAVMHENFCGTEGAVLTLANYLTAGSVDNTTLELCPLTCHKCGRARHKVKDYRAPPRPASQRGPGSQGGQGSDVACFGCGENGNYKNKCPNNGSQGRGNQIRGNQQNPQNNQRQNQGNPKGNNQASTSTQGGRRAPGRVYSLCAEAAVEDNNVVNGTFLINNVYALVLFDTGVDRSFVSSTFSEYINIPPTALDTDYNVELADEKSLTTNTILRGCTLNLQNHLFKTDLLPIELGSFDVIVRID